MCFPSARLRLRHYTRRHLLHPKRIENRHLLTSIRFVYYPTLVRPRQEVMRSRKLGIPSVSENQHFIANMKQVRLGPHPGRERRWPRANRRACREKPFPGPYHLRVAVADNAALLSSRVAAAVGKLDSVTRASATNTAAEYLS